MPSSKIKQLCCSVCLTETESLFYVCKSGRHVICKNCQRLDYIKHRHDDGDHKTEKECIRKGKKREMFYSKNAETDFLHLASGDHFDSVQKKSAFKITISNEVTKKKCRLSTSTPKGHVSKCAFAVMMNADNEKYLEAKSSEIETKNHIDIKSSETLDIESPVSMIETGTLESPVPMIENRTLESPVPMIENRTLESPIPMIEDRNFEQDHRPVTCPVTECSRMVTLESFSQHFNFDHSKVPRIMFDGFQEIYINYSTLSTDAKCFAVFITTPKRSIRPMIGMEGTPPILHNLYNYDKVVLLMGSKILTSTKLFNLKYNSRMSNKNSSSQTEEMKRNDVQSNRQSSSKNLTGTDKSYNSNDEEEAIILLWLCKFDDKDRIYTIMATREDEKQGYSYKGDAVYVKKAHNPNSIYNFAKCLSINKTAINKLVTPKNEFKVLIRLVL